MTKFEARGIIADALRRGVLVKRTRWGPWRSTDEFFREDLLIVPDVETLDLMRDGEAA